MPMDRMTVPSRIPETLLSVGRDEPYFSKAEFTGLQHADREEWDEQTGGILLYREDRTLSMPLAVVAERTSLLARPV
jgi:hypothetical protein